MTNRKTTIARIENEFIFNAQYQLTAREQKVMLYLISNINPLGSSFNIQIIPLKEIKNILITKRSGSFYDEMLEFSARISTKQIVFDSEIKLKGKKMKGFINWFQSIVPIHNDQGAICLQFQFSNLLEPFLLELKEYTQINYLEALPLKSSFSIRMLQIFKAHRNKMAKHQKKSKLSYGLEELKTLLGVGDKYKQWRDFNKNVVQVIEKELNRDTSIKVKAIPTRKGRKVVGIVFEFSNKALKFPTKATQEPITASLSFDFLTFAQLKAHKLLVEYSVTDDIALEMINRVGGSEIAGFEDWYFEKVIGIFEAKTNQEGEAAKAGTLVNWFLKKKIFEQGDHFATLMERLQARKKQLQKEQSDAWTNRLLARNMTSEEFKKRIKKYK